MGPWYTLWRISIFGHLLYFRSTGVPVAWMVTSSGTQATIQYLLNFVKAQNLEIAPAIVMSDRDQVQLNAISAVYPDSTVLLCRWHVLCMMRMHFRTEEFPKLWDRVREWVKTPNQSKFESWWAEMQADPSVPLSFIAYLKMNWMPIAHMWAGSAWQIARSFRRAIPICLSNRKNLYHTGHQ